MIRADACGFVVSTGDVSVVTNVVSAAVVTASVSVVVTVTFTGPCKAVVASEGISSNPPNRGSSSTAITLPPISDVSASFAVSANTPVIPHGTEVAVTIPAMTVLKNLIPFFFIFSSVILISEH